MSDTNDIISILNAINEINNKTKKKNLNKLTVQNPVSGLSENLNLPPDVDRLISEAEKYKKLLDASPKVTPVQRQPKSPLDEDALILTDEASNNIENKNQNIGDFNKRIKNLEESEKKLIIQVEQLKKDEVLQSKKEVTIEEPTNSNSYLNDAKENLKSIYKQVEKQKKLFLDLKNHSIKIERDSNVYKENYERLIIENNELKIKLKIAKEQIVNYETNKTDLLSALNQLNEIIEKSNIVGKISPQKFSTEKNNPAKESNKIEPIE